MPVYRVKFVGEAVIEAPNVSKAASLAKSYKLIGASLGGCWDKNNTQPWRFEKHPAWLKAGTPEKIDLSSHLPQLHSHQSTKEK